MKKHPRRSVLKIIWFAFGFLTLASAVFWFAMLHFVENLGELILFLILFIYSLYFLGAFIALTLIFYIIKLISKKAK